MKEAKKMKKEKTVNDELVRMSRNYIMENAPCLIEYPNNHDIGIVFVSKQGNCYGLGVAVPFCPIELLDRQLESNKYQILQMFGGNIYKVTEKSELDGFVIEYSRSLSVVPEQQIPIAMKCIATLDKDIEEMFNTNLKPLKKFKP